MTSGTSLPANGRGTEDTATRGVGAAPPAPASDRRRSILTEWLPVGSIYFVLGCILTWPLLGRMSSGFFGFGNDNWGGIWFGNWIHRAFWSGESSEFSDELQYPFGFLFDDRYIHPYDRLFSVAFGGIGDGLFAYNAMILLSFPLAGLAMYALARYLTGNKPAAFVAGVIFAASPFHLAMAMQYPAMASIHPVPLFILATIVALRRRRIRDAVWVGLTFALLWVTSYYYGWFGIWFAAAFLVIYGLVELIRALRQRRAGAAVVSGAKFVVTRGGTAAFAFAISALPLLYNLITQVASDGEKFARAENDLHFTATRPWQYILPPHDNPLFGTSDVINSHTGILPVYEQSTYLGAVAVALAFVAIVAARRLAPWVRSMLLPMAGAALFMILVSLGPAIPNDPTSIGDWLAPHPNPHWTGPVELLYDLSPNFRYYGRTFVFTSAVLAAFAALGAVFVLRPVLRRWGPRGAWIAAGLLSVLVLIDFIGYPQERFVDLKEPEYIRAIKQLPEDSPIIEYPVAGYSTPRSLQYVYWQTRHGRPTMNPPETREAQDFQAKVDDPDSFITGQLLSGSGFDFAVVHTDLDSPTFPPYQPAWPSDELPRKAGSSNPWFDKYIETSDAVIYRIRDSAKPGKNYAEISFGEGWGDPENDSVRDWRWLMKDSGALRLYTNQTSKRATVEFLATSFYEPRTLVIRLDGTRVKSLEVPANDEAVSIRLAFPVTGKQQDLTFEISPDPREVDSIYGSGDRRELGIKITEPTLTVRRR